MRAISFVLTFILMCSAVLITGCGPKLKRNPFYLEEVNPYRKRVYMPYKFVYHAVTNLLEEDGFKVARELDPSTFEYDQEAPAQVNKVLIVTEEKKTKLPWPKTETINVYLYSLGKHTDIEIRYYSSRPTGVKTLITYVNDVYVKELINRIEHFQP